MRLIITLSLLLINGLLWGQMPGITASQETTPPGADVVVTISVDNFEDVVSLQYTLSWDPTILTYQSTGDYAIPGLSEFNFGETDVANGILTFVWFDGQVNGITLADDSPIYTVTFTAIGDIGDISEVSFINSPTPIQVGVVDGVNILEVEGDFNNGQVEIISTVLTLQSTLTNNDCFGEAMGSIEPMVDGGVGPYTYNWTGPDNFTSQDASLMNLLAGDYSLTVTDQNNNTSSDVFTITEPDELVIEEVILTTSDCDQPTGSIVLSISGGTPPYSYDFGSGLGPNEEANNLPAGTYPLLILDALNCQVETEVEITQGNAPFVELGVDTALCPGQTLLLEAGTDSDLSYTWTLDNSPLANTQPQLNAAEFGTYEVTVSNADNCSTTDQIVISAAPVPTIDLGEDIFFCENEQVDLNGPSGLTYQWFQDSAPLSETSNTLSVSTAGTYSLIGTNADGCSAEDDVQVTQAPSPSAVELGVDTALCPGQTLLLDAGTDNDLSYTWTLDNSPLANTQAQLNAADFGTYEVTVSNANNCSATDQIVISAAPVPMIDFEEEVFFCENETVELNGPSGLTYQWFQDNSPLGETSSTLSVSTSGTYSLIGTNADGCSAEDEVQVSQASSPSIDLGDDLSICPQSTTSLFAEPGLANYQWFLDSSPLGETSNTLSVSMAGTYSLSGTNSAGCSAEDEVLVSLTSAPSVDLGVDTALCPGQPLLLEAGTDNGLSYSWTLDSSPLANTQAQLNATDFGTYEVTVSNADNCSTTDQIVISPAPVPMISLGDEVFFCENETVELNGPSDLSYQWFQDSSPLGETSSTLSVSTAGTYSLIGTNSDGCTAEDEVQVSLAPSPSIDLGDDLSICPQSTTSLFADPGMASYQWFLNGQPIGGNDMELEIDEGGTYSVEVTNTQACSATDDILVNTIDFMTAAGPDTTIIAGDTIQLFATGGQNYNWSTTASLSCTDCSDPMVSLTETTIFDVTITSAEGCLSTETFAVDVKEEPEVLVEIVNFLSPNNDGKNDVLKFRGLDSYRANQLSIYNRWGDLLYSKPNYQLDGEFWDATFNGQPLPDGIYYYVLEVSTISSPFKSALTIVRD